MVTTASPWSAQNFRTQPYSSIWINDNSPQRGQARPGRTLPTGFNEWIIYLGFEYWGQRGSGDGGHQPRPGPVMDSDLRPALRCPRGGRRTGGHRDRVSGWWIVSGHKFPPLGEVVNEMFGDFCRHASWFLVEIESHVEITINNSDLSDYSDLSMKALWSTIICEIAAKFHWHCQRLYLSHSTVPATVQNSLNLATNVFVPARSYFYQELFAVGR